MKTAIIGALLLYAFVMPAWSKRKVPEPVPPLYQNGVVYSAPHDNGSMGYIVASDAKSGKKLWQTVIFVVQIDTQMELDVQDVFISGIKTRGTLLLVKDERSRCWELDLSTGKIIREHEHCLIW
jgi:outer membrane protein assembly factor BamB